MNKTQIEVIPGPGVLTDFAEIEKRVRLVTQFVDWIQIDIADNKLVPNLSLLDPTPFASIIDLPINFEVHMMVENPIKVSQKWVDIGFKRLLWHIEAFKSKNPKSEILEFKKKGIEIGLAIDKNTHVNVLYPYLDVVDCILVMTIKAGFSGQSFVPELLDKVKAIRSKKPNLPIEVDGGINFDTAVQSVQAGVTRLVSTSTLYNSNNIKKSIEKMKNS